MHVPRATKLIFNKDEAWEKYFTHCGDSVTINQIECIEKMLACGTSKVGSKHYECENPACEHRKVIYNSCKSKACSSCGVMLTEKWIAKQLSILPKCEYQHMTLTMPDKLWPIFRLNPWLINLLYRCAVSAFLSFAKKRGIEIGLFCVVHTFGRQLNWNVHFHLSVTRGGINLKTKRWGNIYFNAAMVEQHWKQQVVSFLRDHYHNLNTKHDNYQHIRDFREWSQFLSSQYSRKWRIHLAKKTEDVGPTVRYLGRYFKRPPIAASRLRHYQGGDVHFVYKDHRDNCYKTLVLSQIEMIDRLVSHIPAEKNFRAIRYYGFLSNRKRGEALPLIYDLLDQEEPVEPKPLNYAQMMHHLVGIDPYKCILCGGRMCFVKMEMGLKGHELVALRKATIREKRRLRYSL